MDSTAIGFGGDFVFTKNLSSYGAAVVRFTEQEFISCTTMRIITLNKAGLIENVCIDI